MKVEKILCDHCSKEDKDILGVKKSNQKSFFNDSGYHYENPDLCLVHLCEMCRRENIDIPVNQTFAKTENADFADIKADYEKAFLGSLFKDKK